MLDDRLLLLLAAGAGAHRLQLLREVGPLVQRHRQLREGGAQRYARLVHDGAVRRVVQRRLTGSSMVQRWVLAGPVSIEGARTKTEERRKKSKNKRRGGGGLEGDAVRGQRHQQLVGAEEVTEVDVPPVGEVVPHEGAEAGPGGALVVGEVILVGEALVDELEEGVVVPVAAAELVGEAEVLLRHGRLDPQPVAQAVAVPGLEEAPDARQVLDGQRHGRKAGGTGGRRDGRPSPLSEALSLLRDSSSKAPPPPVAGGVGPVSRVRSLLRPCPYQRIAVPGSSRTCRRPFVRMVEARLGVLCVVSGGVCVCVQGNFPSSIALLVSSVLVSKMF